MLNILIFTDSRYPVSRKIIRDAISRTFKKHGVESLNAEVSVAVVGARKMKQLTESYLKDGKDHEILTFPLEEVTSVGAFVSAPDDVLRLGDIIICWPELLAKAAENDIMVDQQLDLLSEHGMEHLLGKHHEE